MTLWKMLSILSEGMLRSVEIFSLTLLFSLPLGLVITFGRMSRFRVLRSITGLFIAIMRGTPLMLQLMVVYFGPYFIFKVPIAPSYQFIAVIVGFSVNYAAYFAEIYRGGIESMPVGQSEAAKVLGYSRSQTFGRILLPQVCKRILPPVTNEVITLVKDTSLAFVLSEQEMFTKAQAIAASQTTVMPFVIAGIFYFVFNYLVAGVMQNLEKRFAYYH